VKARVESARSSIKQHVRLSLALVGFALTVLVLFVPGSGANLSPSTFEGSDGNMAAGAGTDWSNVQGGATPLTDKQSGNTDNTFVQGTEENDTTVSIDQTHSAPSKADITKAYVASETVSGDTFLYLSWIRQSNNGDVHVDFELNQNANSDWTDSSTSATIPRLPGDLLISYDFSGSGTPTITSFTWSGSAWGNQQNLSAAGFAEAAVNTAGPITDTISSGTIDTGLFGEASINLNDIPNSGFTPNTCEAFGSVIVKTRSSGDGGTAELKDFISPVPIHVSNCGTVTIVKDANPNGSQSFGYHTDSLLPAPGTFGLVDDGTSANTKTITGVQPGTYHVSEDANPAGWNLTGISCGDDSDSTGDLNTRTATINVSAKEDVTCTFTNTKDATLTITKATDPANSGSSAFPFTASGTGMSPFTLDTNAADATNPSSKMFTFSGSDIDGAKSVTEGTTAGWSLDNVSCTGATNTGSGTTATVTLNPGDNATCTYTNKKDATLKIVKVTDPASSGAASFPFTSSSSGMSNFTLDTNAADNTNPSEKTFTFSGSDTGSKSVTESPTAGWTLTDVSCTGAANTGTGPTATVNVNPGDNVVCTFTNKKNATVTITKDAVPSGAQSFGFTTTGGGPSGWAGFSLQDDGDPAHNTQTFTFDPSHLGTKTVSEGSTAGWTLTDLTCSGGTTNLQTRTASFTLAAGDNVACTYTNKQDATLTITKATDPANSGAATFGFTTPSTGMSPFTLDTNGADATNPSSKTFTFSGSNYGAKSVTEGATPGWSLAGVDCGSATNSGSGRTATVTVNPGDHVTCTYTNQKDATLTIVKVTDPGNSGTSTFPFTAAGAGMSGFTLDTNSADATNPSSKTFTFSGNFGPKSVTEGSTPGWTRTDVTCLGAGNTGTGSQATVDVEAGDDVTCTFTNKKDATLRIVKATDPANSGSSTFPFTTASAGMSDFTLDTNAADATNPSEKTFTFAGTNYGSKSVTEGATTGWTLTGVSCTGAANTGTGHTATVTVNPGDNVVCTFTNTQGATVTITKDAVPNDAQDFAFTTTGTGPSGWAGFSLDDDADATLPNTLTFAFDGSQLGAKSVTEGSTPGWTMTDLTCSKGTVNGSTASFTLVAGDAVQCTYTNKKDATLKVVKVTDPANSGASSFSFTSQSAGMSSFTLDTNAADNTNPADKTFTFSGTNYGSKSVTEAATAGWTLTDVSCTGATNSGSGSTATVDVNPGDNVVCTFTNVKDATLTITKNAIPNDAQDFAFTTTGTGSAAFNSGFSLDDDADPALPNTRTFTFDGTQLGAKTVTEGPTAGWNLTGLTCSKGSTAGSTASVTLTAGDAVTCTYENTKIPTLTVNKVCAPTTDSGKFNLQVDGRTPETGANVACGGTTGPVEVTIGSHTVGETAGTGTSLSDYFKPAYGRDCSEDGSVTLAAGQNKVCTITNTRVPTLTVTKVCNPTSDTGKFNLQVDGKTGPTGADVSCGGSTGPVPVTVGSHTVGETGGAGTSLDNYNSAIGGDCTSITGAVTVAAGENKVCTITNTRKVNPPPPPPPSTPTTPTPPPTVVDLAVVKTVDKASVVKGGNVTYTLTVTNNGPVTDTNVQIADSLPAGVTYVSSASSQGTCSGTAVVQCNIGTMTNGQKVTITIVVRTVKTGTIVNTTTVVGALPETTLTNNTSSVSIHVTAPPAPPKPAAPKPKPTPKPVFKPPVVKPKPKPLPPPCYAVVVAPKSLTVGKNAHLRLHVTAKSKSIAGVTILVKGAGILKVSNRTDKGGHVTIVLHPKKPGIVLVKPAAYKGCVNPRIGVVGAFTPPVTG
jgi:uncharacterized repeat protein (TIGR01451 family)